MNPERKLLKPLLHILLAFAGSVGHSMDSQDSSTDMCNEVLMDSASASSIETNLNHVRNTCQEIHSIKPQTCSLGALAISQDNSKIS